MRPPTDDDDTFTVIAAKKHCLHHFVGVAVHYSIIKHSIMPWLPELACDYGRSYYTYLLSSRSYEGQAEMEKNLWIGLESHIVIAGNGMHIFLLYIMIGEVWYERLMNTDKIPDVRQCQYGSEQGRFYLYSPSAEDNLIHQCCINTSVLYQHIRANHRLQYWWCKHDVIKIDWCDSAWWCVEMDVGPTMHRACILTSLFAFNDLTESKTNPSIIDFF